MFRKRWLSRLGAALLVLAIVVLLVAPGVWAQSKFQTLHGFKSSGDFRPSGDLVFDAAGNLYGTTALGGGHRSGAVFELTPNRGGRWTRR